MTSHRSCQPCVTDPWLFSTQSKHAREESLMGGLQPGEQERAIVSSGLQQQEGKERGLRRLKAHPRKNPPNQGDRNIL